MDKASTVLQYNKYCSDYLPKATHLTFTTAWYIIFIIIPIL